MEVEEVMRSCGGAVQGIREVNGFYLNRSDDGFVFHEDGSYSYGPTILKDEPYSWLTCVSLTKMQRIVMAHDGENDLKIFELSRGKETDSSISLPVVVVTQQSHDSKTNLFENSIWYSHTRCRMPSPTQPWMLQRVKWEKLQGEEEVELFGKDDIEAISVWVNQRQDDNDQNSIVYSAGVTSKVTGLTKCFQRMYKPGGSLSSVSLLIGKTET